MTIDERDIFNYVFFPDIIPAEKKEAIEKEPGLNEAVYFYNELKAESKKSLSRSLRKKIASLIPDYRLTNEVYLYPLPSIREKNITGKRLAADSESRHLISKLVSKTFVDEDKEYMIKVINYESTTKVFVFSVKNDNVKNFDIVVEPQDTRYHFNDNTKPLVIDREIGIESIRLEFKAENSKN